MQNNDIKSFSTNSCELPWFVTDSFSPVFSTCRNKDFNIKCTIRMIIVAFHLEYARSPSYFFPLFMNPLFFPFSSIIFLSAACRLFLIGDIKYEFPKQKSPFIVFGNSYFSLVKFQIYW